MSILGSVRMLNAWKFIFPLGFCYTLSFYHKYTGDLSPFNNISSEFRVRWGGRQNSGHWAGEVGGHMLTAMGRKQVRSKEKPRVCKAYNCALFHCAFPPVPFEGINKFRLLAFTRRSDKCSSWWRLVPCSHDRWDFQSSSLGLLVWRGIWAARTTRRWEGCESTSCASSLCARWQHRFGIADPK